MFEESPRGGRWSAVWWPAVTAVAATLFWLLLSPETLRWLIAENGPIEGTNAALYFVCSLIFLLTRRIEPATRAALGVLFAAFGAREMDWHKALTGKSVLKVSYYLGDAPWQQRLLAFIAVALVAAAVLTLLLRQAGPLLHHWRRRDPVASSVVVFAVTMFITKVIDRMENLLAEDWGIVFAPETGLLIGSLEETIELSLPLIALVAWAQFRAMRR
ncbi:MULTISPECIES: hypothetical protein [unclassified Rubrivivax]|uniref:hypothetical protein n=1 Tax=unclassified Rubrivivax TaxID=2649762 RepID=UPI001E54556C|nr:MULTISPECIES: hypothetical protein [unclassified Rubrivivax]MCC9595166.1 hypothetical protein [Rubrivivax sp. JA1055]MCC9648042.1 hypothetical protein [Rubrivivax sp. JA1029]